MMDIMDVHIKDKPFKVEQNDFWHTISSWEQQTFNIIENYSDKNGIFIDIGAWIGPVTLYASQFFKKIYSVEPDGVSFGMLCNNINLNNLTNEIESYNLAISNENKKIVLGNHEKWNNSMTSIIYDNRKLNFSIDAKTLYDFSLENNIDSCSFLKIDTEGSEFYILQNIENFLERYNNPTLYISFHGVFLKEYFGNDSYRAEYKNILEKIIKRYKKIFHADSKDEYNLSEEEILNYCSTNFHTLVFTNKSKI